MEFNIVEALAAVAPTVTVATFLAVAAKSIVQAVAEPIKKKFPKLDMWWLVYVTWVVGGALSYLAGVNLFTPLLPDLNPTIGLVLTAIVTGGGSSLIYDIFDKPDQKTDII